MTWVEIVYIAAYNLRTSLQGWNILSFQTSFVMNSLENFPNINGAAVCDLGTCVALQSGCR